LPRRIHHGPHRQRVIAFTGEHVPQAFLCDIEAGHIIPHLFFLKKCHDGIALAWGTLKYVRLYSAMELSNASSTLAIQPRLVMQCVPAAINLAFFASSDQ
jgi:hypothetical protein